MPGVRTAPASMPLDTLARGGHRARAVWVCIRRTGEQAQHQCQAHGLRSSVCVLQGGDIYGQTFGAIKPEHMTNEVWDHIFLDKPAPAECAIPKGECPELPPCVSAFTLYSMDSATHHEM